MVANRYEPRELESKWRTRWEESGLYRTDLSQTPDERLYVLVMFIYPSGAKLHVGHWFNYTATDIWARAQRARGKTVFMPMGYDAFGLPAENYAIKHGIHPAESTAANIADIRGQLAAMGAMWDWDKELNTSAPEYYRWTQWFFLKLLEHDLAYKAEAPVNWCPDCKTVLANEQVVEGNCERCGREVVQRRMKQWFFRITRYAQRLLDGLETIDWPEKTKIMQRNWIGRSEGAELQFALADAPATRIKVFTTRPDTVFGATYMVLAPEHPLVPTLTTAAQRAEVEAYCLAARKATEIERTSTVREKTGAFTGAWAINPFTRQPIPIWIADYVLASYGEGAIMAVPAHDQRDWEFAVKFGLPIVEVVSPDGQEHLAEYDQAYPAQGVLIHSGEFDGLPCAEAGRRIAEQAASRGLGGPRINYRLRDWLLSRQRYWGAPIPMINCPDCGAVPVPEDQLPVLLPREVVFGQAQEGESPLATVPSFVETVCPRCGGPARRETETMDTFVCSSWYELRFLSPGYTDGPFDPEVVRRWMPVSQYVGGAEHAVGHLLFSRFFCKFLHDIGMVPFDEPFAKLNHQGMIRRMAYHCPRHGWIAFETTTPVEGSSSARDCSLCGQRTSVFDAKVSKSKLNSVDTGVYLEQYGVDTFRTYLMFMGHFSDGGVWDDSGIQGIQRFLARVYRLAGTVTVPFATIPRLPEPPTTTAEQEVWRKVNRTVQKVGADLTSFDFNTALAAMMELTNVLVPYADGQPDPTLLAWAVRSLVQLVAPFAPHLGEELWESLGGPYSVVDAPWPAFDPAGLVEDQVTLPVQIGGKLKGTVQVPRDATSEECLAAVLADAKLARLLEGRTRVKEIHVPNRMLNLIVR
ncbi:MAG: leucine--tRNA ligase [Myxococcota bacterium]|jgi:leucyl-tRNA synthetase|nr:leucine--tRNA ligase [Myxococcota bacterium]